MTSTFLIIAIVIIVAIIALIAVIILKARRNSNLVVDYTNEQIYVGNLPYRVSEDDLRRRFAEYGTIQSVRVIRNFKTGRSKGFAFVTYTTANEAKSALIAHGADIHGRSMVVRIAKPRQD